MSKKIDKTSKNQLQLDKFIFRRLKSSKKEYLNFEKRLIEEPINYSPLIDHFKVTLVLEYITEMQQNS